MKQGKVAAAVFTFLSCLFAVICVILYIRMDRTAPVIEFQASEVIYQEGMDRTRLLEGAYAYDNTDGDITDRVVIEKIIEDREGSLAVVYYAVSDKSGNVTKAARVFDALYAEDKGQEEGKFPEAGISAGLGFLGKMPKA